MKKIFASLIVMIFVVTAFNFVPVKAFGGGFNSSNIQNQEPTNANKIKTPVQRVVGSIFLVVQIASVIGLLIMGIKYMYSSAAEKSVIKKGTISVVIGLILVFAASTVANFVITAFNQAIS